MARINRVTDPAKIVTDLEMLRELVRQGIDKDYVAFDADYAAEHPGAKFYRDLKSDRRFMVVSGLPRVDDAGRRVEVGWLAENGKYYTQANLFSAVVDGTEVQVSVKRGKATWQPRLFLNGVEQTCVGATLLEVDPDNENYQNNVLEWDYGICKRRLRLIEGAILERWVFGTDPNGEVRIKHNQQGDLKLALGEYQINDDEELVPAQAFNEAEYPFVVGGTLTVYSTSSDGGAYAYHTVYATAHDAANADTIRAGNDWTQGGNSWFAPNYVIERSFLYFDTSSLGADATISAATLSVYDDGNSAEANADHADLGIVEGVQGDPFDAADYGDHETKTTLGADTYFPYPLTGGQYDDLALNNTGKGWISKTGTTLFCLRVKGDITEGTPTGQNNTRIWANEKGSGYQPKLVITYTAVTAKTSSESGAGSEASAQQAALSKNDSGSGSESLGSRDLALSETGSGMSASSLLAVLVGTVEAGLGAEFAAKIFSAFDTGSGVDAVIARLLTTIETGLALEASLLSGALISDDSGLGSELSTLLRALIASDEGSGFAVLRALIEIPATGSDMKLPPGSGQVGIPSKGVNL